MEAYEGYYIVRSYEAGVFFTQLGEHDKANKLIELKNCRKVHYWDGAAAVEQMAMEGVKFPERCRITVEVPSMIVSNPIQIIPCTREAVESLRLVSVWKR